MARRLLNPSATALAVGITVFGLVAIVALVVATWSLKISVDQAADRSLCTFYEFQLSGSPPTTQRGHDLLELARREYERLGCR